MMTTLYVLSLLRFHGPSGRALVWSGREARGQDRAPELHFFTIVQDAVDFCGLVARSWRVAVLEISLPSGFDLGHVRVHDHVFAPVSFLDRRAAAQWFQCAC